MTVNLSRKHLVLMGAGRAHLQVLKGLARHGSGDMNVTLVAPTPYYIEGAMLPGYVAGDYALEDIRVPLDPLVEASGVAFAPAHVLGLDPAARRVQLSSGDALPYDVLSIDVEPVADRDHIEAAIPGARRNALFTRPLEAFVQLWPQLQGLARERPLQVAVLADGLAGVELAMACAHALTAPHGSRVTLVTGAEPLLAGQPPTLQRRVLARLKSLNITVLQDRCTAIDGRTVHLAGGATLVCDAPLLAAGAGTPAWLLQSGLQTDEAGALVLNERLQSDSHRQVFVVPDGAPAEVGPVLEANLRTALGGGSFKKAPLDASRLRVVGCGDGHAIAVWGSLGLEGREVGQWKDRRDRRQLAALFAP
ncbi:FAD-dependent oxidoreductase [Ottowia sp.]|jgi:NADH dehydrogenase FAD-containing subunit|uniref:NAD(P)/FAD-dependent oxidoreductase n=1 Tax=Ottowia sp. TaxID=1898956 RepID=UPI0025FAF735|nr:FAD-dependent oxidoreductase [Ottowia sp.]MBK6612577.1 FAD-dependent oxidoreductase [Ottowia sp.]MBK6748272.1 FAD-dependent oxidoreductase [Ottowia sp.]